MSICPKNKSSKARRDKRMMPHRVCKACGAYNKREIISVD